MTIYRAPVDDVIFLLNDVFKIDRYNNLPGFGDVTRDVRSAVLIEAARLSEEVLHPLNSTGDQEGCRRLDDGSVQLPQGFKQAFREIGDGGWVGLSAPLEYGGQNFPSALTNPIVEFMNSANMSLWMYSSLARGAVEA